MPIKSEVSISYSLSFFYLFYVFSSIFCGMISNRSWWYIFYFYFFCDGIFMYMFFWNLCNRWRMMWRIVVRSVTSERGSQTPTDSNGQICLLFILCVFFINIVVYESKTNRDDMFFFLGFKDGCICEESTELIRTERERERKPNPTLTIRSNIPSTDTCCHFWPMMTQSPTSFLLLGDNLSSSFFSSFYLDKSFLMIDYESIMT